MARIVVHPEDRAAGLTRAQQLRREQLKRLFGPIPFAPELQATIEAEEAAAKEETA